MKSHINQQLSIGEKIRNFRKRAGLSQLDLEVEIDASPGSVSRMESGKVNPTKETLIDICSKLKLPPTERFYLLDRGYDQITAEDVVQVTDAMSEILDVEGFLGYLIDDKYNIVRISKTFQGFLLSLGVNPEKLLGKNMIEVVFDPELGIRGAIDPDNFEIVAINLLSFFNQELNYRLQEQWWTELYDKAQRLEGFQEIWEKTKIQRINAYSPAARSVRFKFGNVTLDTSYSLTAVFFDPRFTLTEYQINPSVN